MCGLMRQRRRFLSFCFSDRSFSLLLISPVSTHTHTTGWLPAPIPIAISTSLKLEASWPASRAKSRQPRPDEKNRITRPSSFPISWNRFSGYYYYFLLLKKKGLPRPRKRRNPVRRDKKNATQSGTEGPVVAVANVDCFDFYCLFFLCRFFYGFGLTHRMMAAFHDASGVRNSWAPSDRRWRPTTSVPPNPIFFMSSSLKAKFLQRERFIHQKKDSLDFFPPPNLQSTDKYRPPI